MFKKYFNNFSFLCVGVNFIFADPDSSVSCGEIMMAGLSAVSDPWRGAGFNLERVFIVVQSAGGWNGLLNLKLAAFS